MDQIYAGLFVIFGMVLSLSCFFFGRKIGSRELPRENVEIIEALKLASMKATADISAQIVKGALGPRYKYNE